MNIKLNNCQRLEIKRMFDNGVSTAEIASKFSIGKTTVREVVNKLGGKFKPFTDSNRKYKLDETCFGDFSSEHSLYFYGLLLGDGNISKDRPRVSIALKKSDKEILNSFALFLGTDRPLGEGKLSFSLTIDSVKIASCLSEQNFEPAKSTKEKLPKFYNRNDYNMRHFWRGLVDADGSLYFGGNSENICLLSSLEVASEFREFIKHHLNIQGSELHQHCKSKDCFYVKYHCRNALSVADMLYKDSNISLKRKLNLYFEFMKREVRFIEKDINRYISFNAKSNKWRVSIRIPANAFSNNQRVCLGSFNSKEEAIADRDEFVSLLKETLHYKQGE